MKRSGRKQLREPMQSWRKQSRTSVKCPNARGWKARKAGPGKRRRWPLSAALRRMDRSAKICCYFPPAEGGTVTPPECLMDEAALPAARRKSPAEESRRD